MDALKIQRAIIAGFDWGARTADIIAALWPLIQEVDVPIRERRPYQSRERIDDASELVLHSGPFLAVLHDTVLYNRT
jgi:hypothetical protein